MSAHADPGPGAARGPDEPVSITTAPPSQSEDLHRRTARYLVQMGIRTVCFVGGVLLWGHVPVVIPLVMMLAATVLPFVAVVVANVGVDTRPSTMTPADARTLERGRAGREDHR